MNHGFVKIAAAIPAVKVGDCSFNRVKIESLITEAESKGVEIIAFPELSITGYSCADLFSQELLLKKAESALERLVQDTRLSEIIGIVGVPVAAGSVLLNAAVVFQKGKILGIVPKTYLPNYREFYEMRWFAPANSFENEMVTLCGQQIPLGTNLLFRTSNVCFGIEICEDLWSTIPPSSELALKGAEIVFNLSADNEGTGKHAYLHSLIRQQSARCLCGYVFSSCGFGESTTDVVFGGNGLIYENGTLLAASERFSFEEQLVISEIDVESLRAERRVNMTYAAGVGRHCRNKACTIDTEPHENRKFSLTRKYGKWPFIPSESQMDERCGEIFDIQISGLAKRLVHIGCKKVIIGISGGLDSTLALLVCAKTFDKLNWSRKDITGITMPGFGTTSRTHTNAVNLMESLEINIRQIDITKACKQHFQDIGHKEYVQDATYENSQARERTQILMDIANQENGIVIGTGDLSELALGFATYNGDHMSMYGLNAGIPKTLIKYLLKWVALNQVNEQTSTTLLDIIDTPISPELIPADENGNIRQITEDLVGPYELHDFFLYYFLRYGFRPAKIYYLAGKAFKEDYSKETIKKWLTLFFRRFFSQQFKRSCLPDGPKVGSVSLSPRGDWRMPSDASAALWVEECESL